MNKHTKRMKKIVKGNLDSIYEAARTISEGWDKNTIPVFELAKILDFATATEFNDKRLLDFQKAYNEMINTLMATCTKKAREMKSDGVSIEYLKQAIDVLKKALDESIK